MNTANSTRYGVWAQRYGETGGHWVTFGAGVLVLADSPELALSTLDDVGRDGSFIYRATPYDKAFTGYPAEGSRAHPLRPQRPRVGMPQLRDVPPRFAQALVRVPRTTATIAAATSLSPRSVDDDVQLRSTHSWRAAGCRVVAVQDAAECEDLRGRWLDLTVVTGAASTRHSGRFVPIATIVRAAAAFGDAVMLINADCKFVGDKSVLASVAAAMVDRGGVCCIHRHDVEPDGSEGRVTSGIDGFLFSAADVELIAESDVLCMGKPYWDYYVPLAFLKAQRPVFATPGRMLVHHRHAIRWDSVDYKNTEHETMRLLEWRKSPREMLNTIHGAQIPIEVEVA